MGRTSTGLRNWSHRPLDEQWKDIDGAWCRRYQVSNTGLIRAPEPLIPIGRGRPCPAGIIKSFPDREGYLRVGLRDNSGKKINRKVSRLVAMYFVINDDPDNKIEVDHVDGNSSNDIYTNLEWVTVVEQQRRRVSRARLSGKTSSKYIGVTWHYKDRKWCAQLNLNRKRIYIGNYDTEIEAAIAYDEYVVGCCLDYPLNNVIEKI